ncbi:hypothetical protein [Pseudonocardia sp. KRD291]|uniref:hypothetical protein n=1 Tax=Pseudonocardia sp. KRD291 TaxID=2792007 RepID=UPI001C4A7328|nr:hypothetical protein [Pseudonocardia sp. KRD291]MBW0101187.1 hypothetical protein [Pseudonocardia sp. KRD291]
MSTSQKTSTDRGQDIERNDGLSSVMSVGVRVAGRVPTRVDLRFAGTAEQQIGLSLGTVLALAPTFVASFVASTAGARWSLLCTVVRVTCTDGLRGHGTSGDGNTRDA